MGIDPQIRSFLRERYAPGAFSTEPRMMRDAVVIDDVMTRVFMLYGPSTGGTFTGEQFFKAFFKPIREAFLLHQAEVYVAVCDDQRGVPVQKGKTQAKRAKASKDVPYVGDFAITAEGIKRPTEPAEPFLTRRLFRTRSMRMQVWQLMLHYLRQQNFPAGKTLVFDFDREGGPWLFHGTYAAVQVPELKHELGEADMSIPFYINLLADHQVFVTTTDTDVIPILLYSLPYDRVKGSVYWVYPDKRKENKRKRMANGDKPTELVYVDMEDLRYFIVHQSPLCSPDRFALLAMMGGSDYLEKKTCFHWFGLEAFIDILSSEHTIDLIRALENNDEEGIKDALSRVVRALWSKKLNGHKEFHVVPHQEVYEDSIVRASASLLKRHIYPTDDDLTTCANAMLFQFHYWSDQPNATVSKQQRQAWLKHTYSAQSKAQQPALSPQETVPALDLVPGVRS